MSVEVWKPVLGFESFYLISSSGRLYGIKSQRIRKLRKDKDGYLFAILSCGKRGFVKNKRIHTLVAEAFICPRQQGKEINHKNGQKDDNRPENLEWVTRSENELHAYRELGFVCKFGIEHHAALLTPEAVRYIRRKYVRRKYTQDLLAAELCVSRQTISDVLRGKKWRHVV
jgi:hypothetical protein